MKRYSVSLVIREIQIKIRVSYSYPFVRMAKMRKMEKKRSRYWGEGSNQSSPMLLVEVQIGAASLENCLALSVTAL